MKESPLRDTHISIDGWNVDKPPRISGEIVGGQRKKERERKTVLRKDALLYEGGRVKIGSQEDRCKMFYDRY